MPGADRKPKTLYDKVLDHHIVNEQEDGTLLIYIDRHLVHEVTSPQAFEGLKNAGRKVRRPDCTLVTVDHVCLSFLFFPPILGTNQSLTILMIEHPHLLPQKLQER